MGKILAEYKRRKREELKNEPKLTLSHQYGTGDIIAIGSLGVLGYSVDQSKKGEVTSVHWSDMTPVHWSKVGDMTPAHKFEME